MQRVRVRPRGQQNYVVVPQSELEGIKDLVDDGTTQRARQQNERERLKKLSESRVSNWPNTIEASRVKKQQERTARLAAEEKVRSAADAREADLQAQQREEAIARANMMLYEQDDKVKTFKSKMFLTAVLEERHMQLQAKRRREEVDKDREAEWVAQMHEQLREAKVHEDARALERRDKAKQTQLMQREQLADVGRRVERRVAQNKAEGEAIRRAAEAAILQELDEERARRERARSMAKEYEDDNMQLERHRAELARLDELEEQKIARFAQRKEEQMLERKRRQEDKFRRDLERRQAMIQKQSEALSSMKQQAEARIQRDVEELEVKQENREIMDKERKLKLWKDIQDSRAKQLARKEYRAAVDKQEQAAFQRQWAQTADVLLEDEATERARARNRSATLQQFQRMQAQERTKRIAQEKQQERHEGDLLKSALAEEDEMFQKYVDGVMAKAYHPPAPQLKKSRASTAPVNQTV